MAVWDLTRVATIKSDTGMDAYFAVIKDGVQQPVPDPHTYAPLTGYLRLSVGRKGGSPYVGIVGFAAATPPPDDIASTVWSLQALGPVVKDVGSATIDFAVLENGSEVSRRRFKAYIDAGSPVGYGFSVSLI